MYKIFLCSLCILKIGFVITFTVIISNDYSLALPGLPQISLSHIPKLCSCFLLIWYYSVQLRKCTYFILLNYLLRVHVKE